MAKQYATPMHPELLFEPFSQPPPYHAERFSSILKSFLKDMEFIPTDINPVNQELEDYMKNVMHDRGLECRQLTQTLHLSAALIEMGYHEVTTLEEKKNVALFTWFAIYLDDRAAGDSIPTRDFSSRLLRRQQQLDPVLTAFTEVLDRMWNFYDPLIANAIFNAMLAFMTGSCIEPELDNLPLIQGVERFSWYLRDLTGIAIAYSLFSFTKRNNFNMLNVIQALPDMNFWTCVTNDLLSFHKEELAGEIGTYIHNRAKNDNKSRYETCEDIVAELGKARQTIHASLASNPAALKTWKAWERGYVHWHIIQERYRLKDLGISL